MLNDENKTVDEKKIMEECKIVYDLYNGGLGAKVKAAIDSFDPYCVFPNDDGPYDEYDRESMIIASKIKEDMTEEEIAVIIANVYTRWFNKTYHMEDCLYPAREIYEYLSGETRP